MLKQIFKNVKLQNLLVLPKGDVNHILKTQITNKPFGVKSNLTYSSFHTSSVNHGKVFYDYENAYAFGIINKYSPTKVKSPVRKVTTLEEFNATLDQNWRESSATEIVKVFANVQEYCAENGITVADTRFDKLVDGLMDHCDKLSYDDLVELLSCLCNYPLTDSYTSHNFHDIWSCLDDICCWKMIEWETEQMFTIAHFWYRLNLGKMSDYIFVLTDRLCKKADNLTKDQLINIYFYFNICRRRSVDFEYEYALEKQINNMNVDEMAVIAMGYFKTKTKIKIPQILSAMVQQVTENSKTVHDISLTAILKILRYSKPFKILPQVNTMLDKLSEEIDRLSDLCCLHVALIGTSMQTFHRNTVQKVSERIVKNIDNIQKVRLKDIERLLNVLTMFDFDPKTEPDIYKAALNELQKEERLKEIVQYPRCLPSALHYLSLRNIYSYELMNRILDVEFIQESYGKTAKNVPQVLFSLNACIDIECPGYDGNRLPPEMKYKAVKWLTDFTPSYDQYKKITASDQLVLDTIDTVKAIVKDDKCIFIDHVLPHFSRADIILCRHKKTGEFLEPKGFENYVLGDVMFPFNDESLHWLAIVILGWNNTVRDSSLLLGHSIMKERQLKKVGYTPVMVIWNQFMKLSQEDKVNYILRKLS